MKEIYKALAKNDLSPREAVELVLYHSEYGGNRTDAKWLVEEWLMEITCRQEDAALER